MAPHTRSRTHTDRYIKQGKLYRIPANLRFQINIGERPDEKKKQMSREKYE